MHFAFRFDLDRVTVRDRPGVEARHRENLRRGFARIYYGRVPNMMFLPLILAIHTSGGDRDLVARLQRRDPQALAELYDRYGRLAYSLVLRIVRDGGIAEDLVQETFL